MGFPVPVGQWFKREFRSLLTEYVLGARVTARGLFEPAYLQRLVDEHCADVADHSERLWALVNVEMWHRVFIDGEPLAGTLPEAAEWRADARSAA
jgi:asparagine synthase (glutamine-hydrolysing)